MQTPALTVSGEHLLFEDFPGGMKRFWELISGPLLISDLNPSLHNFWLDSYGFGSNVKRKHCGSR